MTLYHAAPVVRALAIMLQGFHDGRDGASAPLRHGIYFEVEPERPEGALGIVLEVEDAESLRRFAVSLWPQRREGSHGYFYLLPADVANCYAPRMVGEVTASDRLAND
ncbi:MAG: hypothetical protein JWO85_2811 [Candidatus Eremiobacteraeota bacterium]|jgi:hypothetical protein|nr:hypothetical protein [Candidatus Eremiobacteraeota bacterium]